MSYNDTGGIEPTIQLNSVGIGFQLDNDGNAINLDGLDLNKNEYLVVGEKTYYPQETSQNNTKWNFIVNSEGVAVNTSRSASSNFLDSQTSLFVDNNIYCSGIIKANGLELNNIVINNTDPLTSSLIREFIISANKISANQPFQAGIDTSYEDVYNFNYNIKNVYSPSFLTLGGYVDTYINTHPLNIVSNANNKADSLHISIRNDVNNEDEPCKFSMGIIGGSNISPAIISTTRGMPLEFHVSKNSSDINKLYDQQSLPQYINKEDFPALAIDSNNNVAVGINKTTKKTFTRKSLYDGIIFSDEINSEETRLEVNGIASFNDILMYDYYTNTQKHLDEIYIRSSGISVINSTQIKEGDFLGNNYTFNNISIKNKINTNLIDVTGNLNVANIVNTKSLLVNENASFSGHVNFDNDVNFNNVENITINKLNINNDIYIGNKRITPIDINDPFTGYGTYSKSEDGSNYFFVYVHSNIASLDANCNINFPKKMGIGLRPTDGFDGILNIIKDTTETSNNFDITMKNTIENKDYIANIGRLSRLDYGDNSLIINTNKVPEKNNNIYFYPSTDMSEITSNYYLPNIRNTPPTLSLNSKRVAINKYAARVGYELDIEGKIAANSYHLTINNEMYRTSSFLYQQKNFFNLYDSKTDKFCVNYNNLTSYATNMKGFNVKGGINSDKYYQNNNEIETLQKTNTNEAFYTNKKIALGWNGEDVNVPLQIRNNTTNDNNFSVIRIYRGVRGGGANNNADYSGIDICEYDRYLNNDRNAERWFIYKNHTYNDLNSRNVQRIGPLQIGYIDKAVKPKTYGMSFYYDAITSNYHIDVNNPEINYDDKSAMSIYGDLNVHGNINIIDNFGSNYNFRLSNLSNLTKITQYITTINNPVNNNNNTNNDIENNDIKYNGNNILLTPNNSVIVDSIDKNAIPIIVKQDNSNYSVAKFITYADNNITNNSAKIELGIYNSNFSITDDNYEMINNVNKMVMFELRSDDNIETNFSMSYYNDGYYRNFYNYKNSIDDNGNLLGSSTHIGIGNNINNNSNVTLHIDDINKYGIQITNNNYAPAINLLYTGATNNMYHTISGGSFDNNYKFNISVANNSYFNEFISSNVLTIDAFDGVNIRKGARFGFNEDILNETMVIKSDHNISGVSITNRYTANYLYDSLVNIKSTDIGIFINNNSWTNDDKKYEASYKYNVTSYPYLDNSLNIINQDDANSDDYLFNSIVLASKNLTFITYHSNILTEYNSSNIEFYFNNYNLKNFDTNTYDDNITNCIFNFNTDTCNINIIPDISYDNNILYANDLKKTDIIISKNFSNNLAFIDNISSNYSFTYNYSNFLYLPDDVSCNFVYNYNYTSNIINDSNIINIKNELYIYLLPFDSNTYYNEYMHTEYDNKKLINNGVYTNIYLNTYSSNIIRVNSNINYNGDFIAERHNNILYTTSNLLPDIFKNSEIENNYIDYSYDISLIDNISNITLSTCNFVFNNNVNSIIRDMSLELINTNYSVNDTFEIYNTAFTNTLNFDDYYYIPAPNQNDDYTLRIKNYNYTNFKPHIIIANEIKELNKLSGHEIYSYDGVFEVKYLDSTTNENWTPLKIDKDGNAYLQGGLDMRGNIRFDGKIFDANGNDLIEILNKNYYKEYEINSSNIHFNSLGSNGLEINSYSSCNYDNFKFFYVKDYTYADTTDVMVLHKNIDENTIYKLDLYGDIDTSNGILRVEGRDIIRDTCNYILDTSNVISTRITDLVTDVITEEANSSNKFIVNHKYDYNLNVTGSLNVDTNLQVDGNTTILNTDVFINDKLDITNTTDGVAVSITQNDLNNSILNISNINDQVFIITNNGNVGIGVTNPSSFKLDINGNVNIETGGENYIYTIDGRDIIQETCNYVTLTSNVISTRITDLVTDVITEEANSSNKFIVNHKYDYNLNVTGSLNVDTNLQVDGNTTILNTDVFINDKLDITNETNGVAVSITQNNLNNSILNISNINDQVFIITNNGNVGIGVTNPSSFKLDINGNVNIETGGENYIYTIDGRDIIQDTCNYVTHTSNVISTRITDLVTDVITEEANSSNKFIVNHKYDYNLNVTGSLNVDTNLQVDGNTTILNTDVFINDKLDITNTTDGVAVSITQNDLNNSILNISNINDQVFIIKNNGNVGIGVTNPSSFKLDINGNVNIETGGENYIYTIDGRDIIQDTCNYVTHTSNVISTRITDLVTDVITEEANSSNKFIVNHKYDYNLNVTGSLNVDTNLQVDGNTTILNTDVFINDKLDITNTTDGVALSISQNDLNNSILNISNINDQVFIITNNGNVGIGVTNPSSFKLDINGNVNIETGGENYIYTIDGRDIIQDTCNYVTQASNLISTRITDLVTDVITEEANSSNKFIVNHIYNNNLSVSGSLVVDTNLQVDGNTTILNTDVFINDKLDITNTTDGVAVSISQNDLNNSILNISNFNDQVFIITNDGNVGIGVTNPSSFKLDINGNVNIETGGENYIYTIDGRDIIQDTCNYVTHTSNVISTRITDLVTDVITEEANSSNKFIVNHKYDYNLNVTGSLNVDTNLQVDGNTTILNTDVFINDKLDITNTTDGVAVSISQNDLNNSILNISNFNDQVFIITNDGNVGIGVTNPSSFKLDINGNVNIETGGENYIYTIDGRDIIQDTCNYVTHTSNVISTRITDLVTDVITEEANSSNKFIVNHIYNNDLRVSGSLTIDNNLIVSGSTTYLNTDVYTTEQLSITNNGGGVAFNLTQTNINDSILNISNINDQVFIITNNGNVGIGVTNPSSFKLDINGNVNIETGGENYIYTIDGRDIIQDTCNYVTLASNLISTRITDLVTDVITEEANSSNKFIVNHIYNNNLSVSGSLVVDTNLQVDGSTTILNTDVFINDKLDITNTTDGVALSISQNDLNNSILNISNINDQVFIITNDGNVGIGVTNPSSFKLDINGNVNIETGGENFIYTINGRDIIQDTCNYVANASNVLNIKINNNFDIATNHILDTCNYITITSNIITNIINEKIDNSSNTIVDTINNVSNRITQLYTDDIAELETSHKKFIIDDYYNGDLSINGYLNINNSLKIKDNRTNNENLSSFELINGLSNDFKNNYLCGWKISNSNNNYIISSGCNNIITECFKIDGNNGNTSIGGDIYENYKISIDGSILAKNSIHVANKIGINNYDPYFSIDINETDGIKIPVGTQVQRPINAVKGLLRYNTTTDQFEGFGTGNNWGTLGGVRDVNGDTYISAENVPGINNDELRFFTNSNMNMIITKEGRIGVNNHTPLFTFDINETDGIKIPVGTQVQRPSNAVKGLLRYNTTTDQFEGFGTGNNWGTLGGVRDVNGDTYISAENVPGINNDELRFFTNSNMNMIITKEGRIGVNNHTPLFTFDINSADGIKIPVGTQVQRPSNAVKGLLRYNTTTDQFEGFGTGNNWGTLGGVRDVNGDTYISAENVPGINNDELKFFTNSNMNMIITKEGKIGVNNHTPLFTFDINSADGIKIPVGTEIQRPSNAVKGLLRYNTTTDQFEGFGTGNNWGTLGGVRDVNGDTYISAENVPGINNDELRFFTNSNMNMIITKEGDVGIGIGDPTFKMDINGEINASGFNINGTPFKIEFPAGMALQTKHLTYTETRTKNEADTDWVAIDNDLTSGFVIKIKPSHITSKILLNLVCHIGMDYLHDSRWWGLKLYRKIGTGSWQEITGANGTGNNNGTSCWISHNLGADSSIYSHSITNVTGSYEDNPETTENVYYTIYWKSRLDGTAGKLYLNKSAESNDDNYPKPSSSWSATEIWNDGVPYVPPPSGSVIAITGTNVGIGLKPSTDSPYKLHVDGNIKCNSLFQTSDKRFKRNIELIDDTLYLINKVSPISYTTNDDNYKKFGFIAQEIEEIFPDVVNKPDNNNEMYSIDYVSIIPLLTKSIQELTSIVNKQQKEINELKSKL